MLHAAVLFLAYIKIEKDKIVCFFLEKKSVSTACWFSSKLQIKNLTFSF